MKAQDLLTSMPKVKRRRPYPGFEGIYVESDRDWFDNNQNACLWFLENHAAIKAALKASGFQTEEKNNA